MKDTVCTLRELPPGSVFAFCDASGWPPLARPHVMVTPHWVYHMELDRMIQNEVDPKTGEAELVRYIRMATPEEWERAQQKHREP